MARSVSTTSKVLQRKAHGKASALERIAHKFAEVPSVLREQHPEPRPRSVTKPPRGDGHGLNISVGDRLPRGRFRRGVACYPSPEEPVHDDEASMTCCARAWRDTWTHARLGRLRRRAVEGYRRAQHRYIGSGASGKTDTRTIPASTSP